MKKLAPLLLFLLALPLIGAAQGISQLQQFTSTTSPERAITQTVFGKPFRLTGQGTGCAQFSANGTLTSTGSDCGTGSGGNLFGQAWELISGFLSPTTTVPVKINAATTLATTTASMLNGAIYVDGVHYATTTSGINQAISNCSVQWNCGTVVLPAGTSTLSALITLKPNVRVIGQGQGRTVLAPSSSFSDGVVLRENSNAADNIELSGFTIDLSSKADVGGIHIYQGGDVFVHDITVRNQRFSASSKWTLRFGNYVDGNGTSTASHNVNVARIRLENNNTGTYESVLFVNQWNGSFKDSLFKGNTNANTYELISYINNRNVEFSGNSFEDGNADSIAVMESSDVSIHDNKYHTITANSGFNAVTVINSRDISVHDEQAVNISGSASGTFLNFFDRAIGPDGFTSLIGSTQNVRMYDNHIDGYAHAAAAEIAGTVLGTDYTMNQSQLYFDRNTITNLASTAFQLGADNALNTLSDLYVRNNSVQSWNGSNAGAIQLRGYSSDVGQMTNIFITGNDIAPSSSGGSNAALRVIGATVNDVSNNRFVGTFSSYGAISTATGGVVSKTANNNYGNEFFGLGLTASPSYMLDVSGLGHFTGLVDALRFVATSSSATSSFAGGITGPGNFSVQQGSGFVGVATSAPSTNFSVTGNGYFTNNIGVGALNTVNGSALIQGTAPALYLTESDQTSPAGRYRIDVSGDLLRMIRSSTVLTVIDSLGKFGIGTTSPQATLSIGASKGTGALAFPDGTTQNSAGIMIVQDQKASGTNGGSSVAGEQIRTLNTAVVNTIPGASLASNQVTLPAGSYEISGCAPYWIGNKGKAYWFNVTDNSTTTQGMSMYGNGDAGADPSMVTSCVNGYFTITAPKAFELRQYIQVARATNGLGISAGQGTEVYSTVTIRKW